LINLKKSTIYSRVVRLGETFQVEVSEIIKELFPKPLSILILKIFGYEKKYSIITPLFMYGKIIGAFAITSLNLADYFIPSVKNLVIHISTALELSYERKKQRQAQEKIKMLSSAVEQSIDGIAIFDLEDRLTYANRAFTQMLGFNQEEMQGMYLKNLNNKELFPVIRYMKQIKERGRWEGELYHRRKDGSIFPTYISATLLKGNNAMTNGILAVIKDITSLQDAELSIKETNLKLAEQKNQLLKKNIALKEVLAQVEFEKRQIKDQIKENIDRAIIPIINNLRNKDNSNEFLKENLDIIYNNLKDISSSFARKLINNFIKLSSREIEVCNWIKNGHTNKEIAKMLKLSILTIERHRHNIRKKLGIAHEKVNLHTYLKQL